MRLSNLRAPFWASELRRSSVSSSFSSSRTCKKVGSQTYPGFQFLDLLLATFQSYLFCFIQSLLEVFNGLFHLLSHHCCLKNNHILQEILDADGLCFRINGGRSVLNYPLAFSLLSVLMLLFKIPPLPFPCFLYPCALPLGFYFTTPASNPVTFTTLQCPQMLWYEKK
uniref:Uncharacterized protein n=1 Tax=Taeniopygia guttata TaxID=59729 RepID=A0A674GDH3_TAEGU